MQTRFEIDRLGSVNIFKARVWLESTTIGKIGLTPALSQATATVASRLDKTPFGTHGHNSLLVPKFIGKVRIRRDLQKIATEAAPNVHVVDVTRAGP